MIEETISKIEKRVENMSCVAAEKRAELSQLIGALKEEIEDLSKTKAVSAERIARLAELSTLEAAEDSEEASPRVQELSIEGLAASVDEFEASHPKLVSVVNQICHTLANLGI